MKKFARPVALAALVLALAGCTPHSGDTCNPKTDSDYYSQHTDNGKTTTVHLACRQVGINKYEWRNTK